MRGTDVAALGVAMVLAACGGGGGAGAQQAAAGGGQSSGGQGNAAPPTTFAEQVALGQSLYARDCASCHGNSGEGTSRGPRVVGLHDGALPLEPRQGSSRTARFTTVADVATYAVANMPPGAPGSLSAEQYWAILAFDLSANGITLQTKLTPELAATLTIPR